MRHLAPLSVLVLVACAIPEEDFPEAYGHTVCDRLEECDRGDYEAAYEDRAACVDQWAEFADTLLDAADLLGQEYSPEQGRDCLQEIRRASCSEFVDGEYTCELFAEE